MMDGRAPQLPQGWVATTLGDLVDLNPRRHTVPPQDNDRVSFVPMAAVEAGTGKMESGTGRPWIEVRRGYTTFEEGDVLFAKVTPCMENGKIALAHSLVGGRGAGSTEFHVLRPRSCVDSRFLLYFLLRETYRGDAKHAMQGAAGLLRVPASFVARSCCWLPPIKEQYRIVAEIERQFSILDAGVEALKRVQAKLKRYRASVLQAACTGRLVPTEAELAHAEGREYEHGTSLLERLLSERQRHWGGRLREAPSAVNGDFPQLPGGWTWATVGALLRQPMCNGISVKGSDTPPGLAALRLNAMSDRGFDFTVVRYLPLDAMDVSGILVSVGDFFVARGNGSLHLVGRGTLAQEPPFPVVFPDTMIRLRLAEPTASSGWLPMIWAAPLVRHQIERKAKTTAGIWKVAQPDIASILVPLPPLAEQGRIVVELEQRFSALEATEQAVVLDLKRAERLRQSILKQAFEGRLVPQDPADEPASRLLEQIRAEQMTSIKHNRQSGRSRTAISPTALELERPSNTIEE